MAESPNRHLERAPHISAAVLARMSQQSDKEAMSQEAKNRPVVI